MLPRIAAALSVFIGVFWADSSNDSNTKLSTNIRPDRICSDCPTSLLIHSFIIVALSIILLKSFLLNFERMNGREPLNAVVDYETTVSESRSIALLQPPLHTPCMQIQEFRICIRQLFGAKHQNFAQGTTVASFQTFGQVFHAVQTHKYGRHFRKGKRKLRREGGQ